MAGIDTPVCYLESGTRSFALTAMGILFMLVTMCTHFRQDVEVQISAASMFCIMKMSCSSCFRDTFSY